jgi:hypothetical protein
MAFTYTGTANSLGVYVSVTEDKKMKFKRKAKDGSNKVNTPLLLQLILIIAVFALITCASGCRTGGKWVNPKSAGKIIRTSDVQPNFQPLPPVPIVPPVSSPVMTTNAVRSNPVTPKLESAKANPVTSSPKPAGEITPSFEPTVNPTPIKLPQPETKLPAKIVAGDGGCVVITDDNGSVVKPDGWCGTEGPKIAGPCEATPEEKQSGVNWLSLVSFYLVCLLGLIILWVIYDVIKDAIQMKKQGSPIKDHLENLKKPAKGTRGSRKRATDKKKTTKKKSTRKKKS